MKYDELYGAIVTPMKDDKIDLKTFDNILSLYEKNRHQGVIVAGSTGEGESLTINEKYELLKVALKHKNLDVIMAIKSGSTKSVIDEIKRYCTLDVRTFLIVVPAYYKAPQEGIYFHFAEIANTYNDKNIIVYNIPSRTGSNINYETVARLVNDYKNIVGIKDCSLNYEYVEKLSKITTVYCGSDDCALDYLKSGATKFISVCSIFYYDTIHQLYMEYNSGLYNYIMYGYLRYVTNLLSLKVNPIGIKELFKLKGYKSMDLRLPLVPYDEKEREMLKKLIPISDMAID